MSETPDRAPPSSSNQVRRSFTLPARTANHPKPAIAASSSADGIETLFTHTSTKIVSFTADTGASRQSPTARKPKVDADTPGSLPWTSYAERTLAVGVLKIYRVTASNVSFLNSGNLLHTIFPRSQCWCVDRESKFVLRIRQDSYYRIELPYESEEDKQKVEDFKHVLDIVLQYEKIRCPFTRGDEDELPERPKTPPPPRREPKQPRKKAKRWTFDKTWVPEDGPRPTTPALDSDSGTVSSYEDDDRSSVNTDASEAVLSSPLTNLEVTPSKPPPAPAPSVLERAKTFQGLRSVTAPSAIVPSPESFARLSDTRDEQVDTVDAVDEKPEPSLAADAASLMSSADSSYSFETAVQRSPTPPFLDAEAEVAENPWVEQQELQSMGEEEQLNRGRGRHRRERSELTIRASSSDQVDDHAETDIQLSPQTPTIDIHPSSAPSTPPLVDDSDDGLEPPLLDVPTPPDTIRMKRLTGASQRRAFSPMPQPQNLFCPPTRSVGRQFTAALVRKTCEIILGPPAHLVSLMLRIAANISRGAFGFDTYRVRHTGEKIPCSWESDDEDEWEEDDFGIPLTNVDSSTSIRRRERGWTGEVD